MHKQHRQYVILVVVLLACASSVFFGVRSILHSNDEVTTFAVGDWEGITLPRYHGPSFYTSSQRSMETVTLPMTSTSSRSLFHHSVAPSYHAAVATTQWVQTSAAAYKVHQTSDQVARYVGAGSGSAGSASLETTNVQQSAASASFSIPTLELTTLNVRTHTLANNNINITAVNNTSAISSILADAETPASLRMGGIRRAFPSDPEEGETYQEGGVWYWYDPESGWVEAETKIVNGKVYVKRGDEWVYVGDQADPDAPIGDMPWLMLLMALVAYSTCRVIKKKENK